MATSKDDLILISVDDHIAEPADMFDAHVPEAFREFAPRVVDEADGAQQPGVTTSTRECVTCRRVGNSRG